MTHLRTKRCIVSMTIAIASVLHLPSALAGAATQDSGDERGVVVTFTKWIIGEVPPNLPEADPKRLLMEGIVGGDVEGSLLGEVLDRKESTPGALTFPIAALHAIYEIHAGARSFTALIHGGSNTLGRGLLDGIILSGWRTGARVHVRFRTIEMCAGKPEGPCFQGTIRILRDPDE